jgi:hypothetical protein
VSRLPSTKSRPSAAAAKALPAPAKTGTDDDWAEF